MATTEVGPIWWDGEKGGWGWTCAVCSEEGVAKDREQARQHYKEHRTKVHGKAGQPSGGTMTATAPAPKKAKAPKAPKPKAEKKARPASFSLTAAQAKEILDRLRSGKSRLGQERVRAKLTSNTPIRKALQQHVSKKEYRAIIVEGLAAIKAAKAPKPKAEKKAKAPKAKKPKAPKAPAAAEAEAGAATE